MKNQKHENCKTCESFSDCNEDSLCEICDGELLYTQIEKEGAQDYLNHSLVYLCYSGSLEWIMRGSEFIAVHRIDNTDRAKGVFNDACCFYPTDFLLKTSNPQPKTFDDFYHHYCMFSLDQLSKPLIEDWFNGKCLVSDSIMQLKCIVKKFRELNVQFYVIDEEFLTESK